MTHDQTSPAASPRRAVAYLRVSTQQQAGEEALGVQFDKVHRWAQANGYHIVHVFYEVQRGTLTSQVDRPVLHDCLRVAEEDNLAIIALNPSRISRHSEHARKLEQRNPGRFVFVEQVAGYEDRPWSDEVVEFHARLPSTIAGGTSVAMQTLQRRGELLGASDGGKAGRAASLKVQSAKKHSLAEQIADFLEVDPARETMQRRELVPLINAAGIKTTRGAVFTYSRLKRPLKEAETVLVTRRAPTQTLPPNGPLSGAGGSLDSDPVLAGQILGSDATGIPFSSGGLEPEEQPVKTTTSQADATASPPGRIINLTDLSQREIDDMEMEDNPIWGRFG
ncbi:MAG: recombinase family protein [Alphaproteobacteria bacterium]|nr:recombinase family protein [Alphaproteobacteria bacterium]